MILRCILITILAGALTVGTYMIRTQSQELSALRSDIDIANQALNALRNQVQAIQTAYQVRDVLRQEADNVSSQRMQILDTAGSDWADCLLPADISGMFGTQKSAGNTGSDAAGGIVSGNAGPAVDAQDK